MITLLSLAGFMLYGPYSLLAGAIAIDLGSRPAAATAAGIIDGASYLGAVVSGAGMGWLIDHVGWENSFFVLAGAAGLCVLVSLSLWRVRPTGASAAS